MPLRQACLVAAIVCLGLIASGPVLASDAAPPSQLPGDEVAPEATTAPETAAAEPAVCTEPTGEIAAPGPDPVEKSSCCRDECFQDEHCDFKCAPFGGQCLEVNSCCRQCFCFG